MICYIFAVVFVTNVLFVDIGSSQYRDILFVTIAVIMVLTINPLINLIKKQTDRLFYRDDYDPQALINELGKILASVIDLSVLTDRVSNLLRENIRIKAVNIVVLDKSKFYYESAGTLGDRKDEIISSLEIFENGIFAKDNLAKGDQKTILEKYGISVLSTLVVNNERIGYVLYYDKNSGAGYRNKDTSFIEIVSDQLAIGIHNSLSYSLVQRFNATLQRRVDEATEQLRSVNDQLKEADAVKDDFITMTSHQLTTPLTAIDGYLSNATKGYYGDIQDELKKPLHSALSRARVMKQLVVDLLTVSRMSAGKFTLDLAPSDLNRLVVAEVSEFMTRTNENLKLTYHPPESPVPDVYVDEQKIRQVIINLIDNALNYTEKGEITVSLGRDNEWLYFKVVDSGMGVPEEEKAKLFSKFYRAGNAKTERPDGTGIGLYLVKRVIDTHGGEIIFESSEGKGSTFGFKLPFSKMTVPASIS
jgi:signal transduction histidine kinase